jgi:hypothetical protein
VSLLRRMFGDCGEVRGLFGNWKDGRESYPHTAGVLASITR